MRKSGNNEVDEVWRIQGNGKTFIKADTNNKILGLFNLQTPTEDHHAVHRGWVKDQNDADKNYVDQKIGGGPATYAWKHRTSSGKEPADGYMNFNKINWADWHENVFPQRQLLAQIQAAKKQVNSGASWIVSTTTAIMQCLGSKSDGTWEMMGSFRIEDRN